MASFWRDPVLLTFIDPDNQVLVAISRPEFVPRVGENVRIGHVPYLVERVGYDVPDDAITAVWVVCHPM